MIMGFIRMKATYLISNLVLQWISTMVLSYESSSSLALLTCDARLECSGCELPAIYANILLGALSLSSQYNSIANATDER